MDAIIKFELLPGLPAAAHTGCGIKFVFDFKSTLFENQL